MRYCYTFPATAGDKINRGNYYRYGINNFHTAIIYRTIIKFQNLTSKFCISLYFVCIWLHTKYQPFVISVCKIYLLILSYMYLSRAWLSARFSYLLTLRKIVILNRTEWSEESQGFRFALFGDISPEESGSIWQKSFLCVTWVIYITAYELGSSTASTLICC